MRTRKSWAAVEDTQWEGAPVEGTWDVASWTKYAAGAILACTLMSPVCHCQLPIHRDEEQCSLPEAAAFWAVRQLPRSLLDILLWQFASNLRDQCIGTWIVCIVL
jgi:hypothetical protein